MFTGLVEGTGRTLSFSSKEEGQRLVIEAGPLAEGAQLGDSIAINGCCLTVVSLSGTELGFDLLQETVAVTNLRELKLGGVVNLERAMPANGRYGGHFVTGHIDTTGEIVALEPRGKDHYVRVRVPAECTRHIVHKGSIAIDGISLTIAEVAEAEFAVWLIPHTMLATNLHSRRAGDAVNLEFDLLGKHVEKLLAFRSP